MLEFIATKADLEKALSVVILATEKSSESIRSHALCDIMESGDAFLYTTDDDKIAMAHLPIKDVTEKKDVQFTLDPKRIQTLISSSSSDSIKFTYDSENMTLNIYASEDSDAYISFASFNPTDFLYFTKELSQTKEICSVNASLFTTGIKFIQGFLANDDKNKKFSNLFISNGSIYGSNGSFKIGAFKSADFDAIGTLGLRRVMVSSLIALIDKTDVLDITIKASDKHTVFFTSDNLYCFGFKKSITEMPQMPISLDIPETSCININLTTMLKKLNRLSLTSWEDIGLKMDVAGNELSMQTISDRKSIEKMTCNRLKGDEPINFLADCNKLKSILSLYQGSNVDIYIDPKKCTFYSSASVIVEEAGKDLAQKPFIAVGFLTQARVA